MKRYGLRVGMVGVEFSSKEERDKALLCFTRGGTVRINTSAGIRYEDDGDPSFGTYERETNEVLANCGNCHGTFSTETCCHRKYRVKLSYRKEVTDESGFLCDGCLAKITKDTELFEAKQKLAQAGE